MTNAELIKNARTIADSIHVHSSFQDWEAAEKYTLEKCADALEAAEKRIAELEDDLRNGTISDPERFKIYGYTLRDLILFAELCNRNDVREADLKKAAWNLELAVRAVMNERAKIVKNTMDKIMMSFTPDFEKAYEEMIPNCGAKMKTVTECHTLREGER